MNLARILDKHQFHNKHQLYFYTLVTNNYKTILNMMQFITAKSSSSRCDSENKKQRVKSDFAWLQILELSNEDYKITVFTYFKNKKEI